MREGGREREGKDTGTKEHRPSASAAMSDAPEPRCGARGRCRLQGVDTGRHGEMRYLYKIGGRYVKATTRGVTRDAFRCVEIHLNTRAELGCGKP
jgi:hypothetical protein